MKEEWKQAVRWWSVGHGCIQEVSSILLDKLIAAGVGERPVVFVTHRLVFQAFAVLNA
jgi:hypothetical protein